MLPLNLVLESGGIKMTEDDLRVAHLAFVGKLLAGLSHENKNHLAIINESAGLIQDLLSLSGKSSVGNEKIPKMLDLIAERVEKANQMTRYLSRFAHRMDNPVSMFSVNEALEEEVALLERFARQLNIGLETTFEPKLPTLHNSPSLLQFAFYELLLPFFSVLGKDSTIVITTRQEGAAVSIGAVSSEQSTIASPPAACWPVSETTQTAISRLGASLQPPGVQRGVGFKLLVSSLA
jgi:nitrogen-specific signal transduction histidine kinase